MKTLFQNAHNQTFPGYETLSEHYIWQFLQTWKETYFLKLIYNNVFNKLGERPTNMFN